MLKASGNRVGRPFIGAGLSEENVVRLKAGFPIDVPLEDFVAPELFHAPLRGDLIILHGLTEHAARDTFQDLYGLSTRKSLVKPEVDQHEAILRDHPHVLIVTVGLPRSGKTTWARSQGYPIVSPDAIRQVLGVRFDPATDEEVWDTAQTMVQALFLAGHRQVILDVTANTRKRRMAWMGSRWATFFRPVPTPAPICIERARESGDEAIVPVIERMAADHEPLDEDEPRWIV